MQINYCDLCNTPLKEKEYFMLYISDPKTPKCNDIKEYYDYMKLVEKSVKEICPMCKYVFDKMFELRVHRLSELTEEINEMYNLTSLKNPKERKNGKDKK